MKTQEQNKRLVMLTDKLEKMVQEVAKRTAEQEAKREPDNRLQTYQDISSMASLKKSL
ncbi:hypothetical protein [uncultured Paraglaciecola sp.]|uniref:hypothetical protein n=1 Tax=uncultured Paraglaciecola sp. TaxID=1765024 RepID=UPI0030D8B3CA|tara:strand:- start:30492 stop:30665 length:174 start_codon:yes stop_codon:yes gene_type:complete